MPSTLEQVAVFCYTNQRRYDKSGDIMVRDLKEWARLVVQASRRNQLFVVDSPSKTLIGVCIATERPASKTIWVHDIVCKGNAFKTFIKEAFKRFPDYKITGKRGQKITTYTRKNLWADKLLQNPAK